MKKYFIFLFVSLLALTFCACGGDDESGDVPPEQVQDKLIGSWYTSDDAKIYIVNVPSTGKCSITVYTYTSGEWKFETKNGIYTLNNDILTFKLDGESPWTGTFAMTGNNFSFNQNGKIYMFSKYDGKQETLNALKKEIEDITVEIRPGTNTTEENFWQDNSSFQAILNAVYSDARYFSRAQIIVEGYFLSKRDMSSEPILASDGKISELWELGYNAISKANLILAHATKEEHAAYKSQAMALRAFLYYNMAMLWGNIPYITKPNTEDAIFEVTQIPAQTIYSNILSDIKNLKLPENSSPYVMTDNALEVLRHEIYLTLGQNYSESLSHDMEEIFVFPIAEQYDGFAQLGRETTIYTKNYISLLNKEKEIEKNELIKEWNYSYKEYGYLAMLKRIGKLQEVSGCTEHELLFPIPAKELRYNSKLKQNPGY